MKILAKYRKLILCLFLIYSMFFVRDQKVTAALCWEGACGGVYPVNCSTRNRMNITWDNRNTSCNFTHGDSSYCNCSQQRIYKNSSCNTNGYTVYLCSPSCKISSCSDDEEVAGYGLCGCGNKCNNVTDNLCITGCQSTCIPDTCSDLGLYSSQPNTTQCPYGSTLNVYFDGCNDNVSCYSCKTCTSSKTCASYTDYPLTNSQANSQCAYGSTSATKSNGCTNSLTCYKCKTCTPKTCATLGYYATASSASVCQYGYDYGAYSDGCDGSLGCYTCKTCAPSIACANYTDYPLTADQATAQCVSGSDHDTKSNGCTNSLTCYKCKTCASQGYVSSCSNGAQLFVPNGIFGGTQTSPEKCGNCFTVSSPRFQGVGGNIFGQNGISLTLAENLNPVNNFLIRKSGVWNIGTNNSSGLAITNTGGLNLTNAAVTQKNISTNTKVTGTQGYPANRPEDFEHFQSLIDYSQVPNCNNSSLSNFKIINYSEVCKTTDKNLLSADLTISGEKKKVVFVEGDLKINHNITVDADSYLAIIAKGTITFESNLGTAVSSFGNPTEALNQAPDINGVFIADRLDFPTGGDKYCDKALTLGGTFVGWNGITMSRNFKECYTIGAVYPDYNKNYNTLTFKYRPEFVLNTPSWMKQVTELTLESN